MDVDWFTYQAPVGTSTVTLTPTADATMTVGYISRSTCVTSLTNARTVRVSVANAPLTICIAVSSAGRKTQTYRLTH
jgi:hypothetical protein